MKMDVCPLQGPNRSCVQSQEGYGISDHVRWPIATLADHTHTERAFRRGTLSHQPLHTFYSFPIILDYGYCANPDMSPAAMLAISNRFYCPVTRVEISGCHATRRDILISVLYHIHAFPHAHMKIEAGDCLRVRRLSGMEPRYLFST
jgi:hypothetical protein